MLFNSYSFLFSFLPVTLVICFGLAKWRGAAAAQIWLIIASLLFYASWNLRTLPLLLSSIGFNYLAARIMLRAGETTRRHVLISAIIVDLALLGYFKYTNFFIDTLNSASGANIMVATILLPLGISFYTFQQITLLVDISGGTVVDFRFRDFLLFVTFFPHLIAGPIVHHREMIGQFTAARYRYNAQNMAVGISLFAGGFFKKTIFADGISLAIAPIFGLAAAGHPITFFYAWAASIGFTLQMYFDFSGYSEMALGLARMVGIILPTNFNSPLKARSVIEYWGRWHMTLTRFLTAYIYNPVAMMIARSRRRRGLKSTPGPRGTWSATLELVAVPTLITMFLSGLWHGAGWQFILFGALHGTYLVINNLWRLYASALWPKIVRLAAPLNWPLTFICTSVALTYFHAQTVAEGSRIIAGMAGLNGISVPLSLANLPTLHSTLRIFTIDTLPAPVLIDAILWTAALLPIALFAPNLLQILRAFSPSQPLPAPMESDATWYARYAPKFAWAPTPVFALLAAIASVGGILTLGRATAFLYWQF